MDLELQILQFIKKNKLIAPRGLLVLGVSGGADSMALLVALSAAALSACLGYWFAALCDVSIAGSIALVSGLLFIAALVACKYILPFLLK